jgi:hypothetical protein
VKKVKGSVLDKSVRIEMDSPVFRKLQEAIEHPCRSREWFALAEQAINTVYALGDQPRKPRNHPIHTAARCMHLTASGRPRNLSQLFNHLKRVVTLLRFMEETGACAKLRTVWEPG